MHIFYFINLLFPLFFGLFWGIEASKAGIRANEPISSHCSISSAGYINFGKVDSRQTQRSKAQAAIKLQCQLSTDPIHYCMILTKENTPESFLKHGTYEIPFTFYYNNIIFGDGNFGKPITGTVEPIKGQSSQYQEIPFSVKFGRPGGPNLETGIYASWFRILLFYSIHSKSILTDAQKEAMCERRTPDTPESIIMSSSKFMVLAGIENPCSLNSPAAIDFGKVWNLDNVKEAWSTIQVDCSVKTNYEIGLNTGNNARGSKRAMKCTNSQTCGHTLINYELYQKPGGNKIWNNQWGSDGVVKSDDLHGRFPVYGRVLPHQSAPAGKYADRIIVEVRW